MSVRVNPIRLFVTHCWEENDDYTRVFEYLEASGTFYYVNTSQPQAKRPIDKESQREDLRRQIAPCEVVIVLPAVYRAAPDLVLFQMTFAIITPALIAGAFADRMKFSALLWFVGLWCNGSTVPCQGTGEGSSPSKSIPLRWRMSLRGSGGFVGQGATLLKVT